MDTMEYQKPRKSLRQSHWCFFSLLVDQKRSFATVGAVIAGSIFFVLSLGTIIIVCVLVLLAFKRRHKIHKTRTTYKDEDLAEKINIYGEVKKSITFFL